MTSFAERLVEAALCHSSRDSERRPRARMPCLPEALEEQFKRVMDEVESRHLEKFAGLFQSLGRQPSVGTIYGIHRNVLASGINWGRIITVLLFTRKAMELCPEQTLSYLECTKRAFREMVEPWQRRTGEPQDKLRGWLERYELNSRKDNLPMDRKSHLLPLYIGYICAFFISTSFVMLLEKVCNG